MSDDQEGSQPPAPPFRGIIETTLDALLVFEASRRGIIPRITRRLAEKERGMIQSGAVFVFDEGESGIKRWTDGLYWSPSRILSNFLVYRETDKRADRHNPLPNVEKSPPPKSSSSKQKARKSPPSSLLNSASSSKSGAKVEPTSPGDTTFAFQQNGAEAGESGAPGWTGEGGVAGAEGGRGTDSDGGDSLEMDFGEVALGAVAGMELESPTKVDAELVKSDDPEATAAAARLSEKARERQLVGSLTTTYKFKEKGLVKKTISVSINGVAQHMVSYYSMEDALSGRLRSPSTLPELFALDISPDYLSNKHFRFPPKVEIGPDGVHRYRGEPDEPQSPPLTGMSLDSVASSSTQSVKVKRETEPKRRASKASTSSTNSGHNVAGPSPSWQATPTPTSWGGRASSPHRLQQQQLRPPRPQTLQRRASEQSYYESSMASPLWNGNQQQLSDHQLQYQQQQPRGAHPIPNSTRRQPSPPSSAASSYEQQGFRPQPQYAPNGVPYPDTIPSVLARPIEMRRQSLQIGMERREPSPGSAYAVSPSRGSFPRNQRMYHPYAGGDGGQEGGEQPFSAPMMKRRSTQSGGGRASPTSGRAFPASPPPTLAGLPPREGQHSPTEDISPTLEPEQDFAEYSYVPYDPHSQAPPPTLQQHQSPSQSHPLQHSQYQHPHPPPQQGGQPTYFSGGPPQASPPLHHDQQQQQQQDVHDPYGHHHQQQHPSSQQPYSLAPTPYPPQQHQQYYDPSGRGPPQQTYDQYGRPSSMDPYAYQHQQVMDDRRYASGMVGGGGAMHSGVKEEEIEGYSWGYGQPQASNM